MDKNNKDNRSEKPEDSSLIWHKMQADNDDKPKGLQPKCSRGVPLSESPTGVLAASKRLRALSRHPCVVLGFTGCELYLHRDLGSRDSASRGFRQGFAVLG